MHRAANLLAANVDDLARTISLEEGKPLSEARGEGQPCAGLSPVMRV